MDLLFIYRLFPCDRDCIAALETARWGAAPPICPYCDSSRSTRRRSGPRHLCNDCGESYSVTVNTVLHHTHLPPQKCVLALSLIREGHSVRELASRLEVNKNTAQRIAAKVHHAMRDARQRDFINAVLTLVEERACITIEEKQ